jgi:hypothetical protein
MIDTNAYHASRIFFRPLMPHHEPRPASIEEIGRLFDALAPRLTISMTPQPMTEYNKRGALWAWRAGKRLGTGFRIVFYPVQWGIDRSDGHRSLTLREFCEFYGLNLTKEKEIPHERAS